MKKETKTTKVLQKLKKSEKEPTYPIVANKKAICSKLLKIMESSKKIAIEVAEIKEKINTISVGYRVENKISGTIGFKTNKEDVLVLAMEKDSYNKTIDPEKFEKPIKKLVKKEFDRFFKVKREISFSDTFLKKEENIDKLIKLIEKNFGLKDVLDIKQYLYPTTEFTNERYAKLSKETNQQLDETFKATRTISIK
jgi:hypothetical protein